MEYTYSLLSDNDVALLKDLNRVFAEAFADPEASRQRCGVQEHAAGARKFHRQRPANGRVDQDIVKAVGREKIVARRSGCY